MRFLLLFIVLRALASFVPMAALAGYLSLYVGTWRRKRNSVASSTNGETALVLITTFLTLLKIPCPLRRLCRGSRRLYSGMPFREVVNIGA